MIAEDGTIEIYPMEEWLLIEMLTQWSFDECVVYIEKASVRPGQGISSSATFMEGAGFIRGVVETLHIPAEIILPSVWKRHYGIQLGKGYSYKEKKQKDIEFCKRLFPNVSLKKTPRSKVDSDGFADALLIAEFCRRKCK